MEKLVSGFLRQGKDKNYSIILPIELVTIIFQLLKENIKCLLHDSGLEHSATDLKYANKGNFYLTSGSNSFINVLSGVNNRLMGSFKLQEFCCCFAIDPNDKYVACGDLLGFITIFSLANIKKNIYSNKPLVHFKAHLFTVSCINWHGNGEQIISSCTLNTKAKLWQISGNNTSLKASLSDTISAEQKISCINFQPNGTLLVICYQNDSFGVWNTLETLSSPTQKVTIESVNNKNKFTIGQWSPNGEFYATGGPGMDGILIWRSGQNGQLVKYNHLPSGRINDLKWNQPGTLLVSCCNKFNNIKIWDPNMNQGVDTCRLIDFDDVEKKDEWGNTHTSYPCTFKTVCWSLDGLSIYVSGSSKGPYDIYQLTNLFRHLS